MQRKPLDVGNGTVCASFGLAGSLLPVGASHPVVGLVELTAAPVFPAERDGDADAVRQHRLGLLDPSYGVVRIISTRADALSGEPRRRAIQTLWPPGSASRGAGSHLAWNLVAAVMLGLDVPLAHAGLGERRLDCFRHGGRAGYEKRVLV
jgi:hypothetical protein